LQLAGCWLIACLLVVGGEVVNEAGYYLNDVMTMVILIISAAWLAGVSGCMIS
jgi:hypothetical protein